MNRIETYSNRLKQIETVGNDVNSDCAQRNGGQPSSRERAAAGGPDGQAGGPGGRADQYSEQQFYNTIYFNTFIKQFFFPVHFASFLLQILPHRF